MTNRAIPCPDGFDAVEDSLTRSRMIIDALRAEVARFKGVADSANMDSAEWRDKMDKMTAEVAALKAKLARYEGALTDEQARRVMPLIAEAERHEIAVIGGYAKVADAAIRKVRGEP